jgi:hypothetical protein
MRFFGVIGEAHSIGRRDPVAEVFYERDFVRLSCPLSRLHFWRPVVRLALETTTPGVERVVNDHAVLQHFVVVGEDMAEAKRDCEQTG